MQKDFFKNHLKCCVFLIKEFNLILKTNINMFTCLIIYLSVYIFMHETFFVFRLKILQLLTNKSGYLLIYFNRI